jgi:hypothetical protein
MTGTMMEKAALGCEQLVFQQNLHGARSLICANSLI